MSARSKLNMAYITGNTIIALLVAALAQSWVAFAVTFGILGVLSLCAGDVRLKPRKRNRR